LAAVLKVLTGHGAAIVTNTAAGKRVFGHFCDSLSSSASESRSVWWPAWRRRVVRQEGRAAAHDELRQAAAAMVAMRQPEISVGDLCE